MQAKTKGMIQMLCCSSLWSIGGIFIKLVTANPFVIAGFRSAFSAFTVACFMLFTKSKLVLSKKSISFGLLSCVLFFCFVVSNKLTTAANAIVLEFTSPIFLMIYSAIFAKAKFHARDAVAAVCTLIGVSLCFIGEMEGGHMLGNIIAIGSGATMGAMYLMINEIDGDEKFSGLLLAHVFTAVIGIAFWPFTSGNNLNPKAFLFLAILGIFQLGIPYVLLGLASKTCPPLACNLLGALEPLLNPVWVALFDGEKPGILAFFGGIIVIAAVSLWCVLDAKAEASGDALTQG